MLPCVENFKACTIMTFRSTQQIITIGMPCSASYPIPFVSYV
ncbi:hypothetical protein AIOL_003578 [Candidatus Rhodobacter oscarellae]|uniref:Uncharacterized protein n=1 Tax=Candidatus Rhodobacter oscarellae TaxID=1675527 RepID=A0A0J9E756_9RHOB|nr:hypothetical protein AIOL_003578 [Candidatus Rhodobacter lobularis]